MTAKVYKWAILLFVFGGIIFRFTGAVAPPSKIIYSVDERILTESTLLLFVNTTPNCLEWPGCTLILPLYIFCLFKLLFFGGFLQTAMHFTPRELAWIINDFIFTSMTTDSLLIYGRAFIALLAVVSYFFIFKLLKDESFPLRMFFCFLYTVSGTLIIQSWTLHPDSIGIVFWILLILQLIYRDNFDRFRNIFFAALLFALCVVSKFIYLIFAPLIFLYIFLITARHYNMQYGFKLALRFALIFIPIIVLLCPFIWTNSFTLLKGFVGNIVTKTTAGEGNSFSVIFTEYFNNIFGYTGMLLAAVGIIVSFNKYGFLRASLLLLAFILFLIPVGNASLIYERYVFPLIPMLFIWAAVGFEWLMQSIYHSYIRRSFAVILFLLILYPCVKNIVVEFHNTHIKNNYTECLHYINTSISDHASVGVPDEFDGFVLEDTTSLIRMLMRNNEPDLIGRKLNNIDLSRYDGKSMTNYPLEHVFLEEKLFSDAKLRIKLLYLQHHSVKQHVADYNYYSDFFKSKPYFFEAGDLLNSGMNRYFVSREKLRATTYKLKESFDQLDGRPYYLYEKNNANQIGLPLKD